MSSELYDFDPSYHKDSSSDMFSSDRNGTQLPFLSDSYSFGNFSTDVFQINSFSSIQKALDEIENQARVDPLPPSFFDFSPPNTHLESLNLYQPNSHVPLSNFSVLDGLEVKTEECQMGSFDYNYTYNQQFVPHSYSEPDNVSKFMQKSHSFDGKPGFLSQPPSFMDSGNFQSRAFSSPENTSFTGQMRKVCSTGDLQNFKGPATSQHEGSFLEDTNFKVGRYSAEERKERISKYRAKRSQRNFNKTIKYACRKTLADNRPRIRGRFARNDESSEIPKVACSSRDEDEDELWFQGMLEDPTAAAEQHRFVNNTPQFHSCGF